MDKSENILDCGDYDSDSSQPAQAHHYDHSDCETGCNTGDTGDSPAFNESIDSQLSHMHIDDFDTSGPLNLETGSDRTGYSSDSSSTSNSSLQSEEEQTPDPEALKSRWLWNSARYILALRQQYRVTQTATNGVIQATQQLLKQSVSTLTANLDMKLRESGVDPTAVFGENGTQSFIQSSMPSFDGIHTAALQRRYFIQNFKLLVSMKIFSIGNSFSIQMSYHLVFNFKCIEAVSDPHAHSVECSYQHTISWACYVLYIHNILFCSRGYIQNVSLAKKMLICYDIVCLKMHITAK